MQEVNLAPVRPGSDDLLSIREIAQLAGVAEVTVRRWIERGLVSTKLGGSRRVYRADFEEFAGRHRTELVQDGDRLEVMRV